MLKEIVISENPNEVRIVMVGIQGPPGNNSGGGDWGEIDGNITDQTDLSDALDSKLNKTGNEQLDGNLTIVEVPDNPFPEFDVPTAEPNPTGFNKEYYISFGYYFAYKKSDFSFTYAANYTEIAHNQESENYQIKIVWENTFEADSIEIYREYYSYDEEWNPIVESYGMIASLSPDSEEFIDDNTLEYISEDFPTPTPTGVLTAKSIITDSITINNPISSWSVTNLTANNATITNLDITNLNIAGSLITALNTPIRIWGTGAQSSGQNFGIFQFLTNYILPANKTTGLISSTLLVTSNGGGAFIGGIINDITYIASQNINIIDGYSSSISILTTGTVTSARGFIMHLNHGGGTITNALPFRANFDTSAGTVGTITVGRFYTTIGGTTAVTLAELNLLQRLGTGSPTCTTLRGMAIRAWTSAGTITNSVGIYIDNTIDIGTASKYAILCESTSDSKFSGNIEIDTNSKNLILRSPDNSRWKIEVDNSGVLTASAV